MDPIPPTVTAHVAAGTVALAAYWTAGLAKKGSPLHRRAGQVFLLAMAGILASGVPLVLAALAKGHANAAAFLGYLLLLVAQGCWSAWRAVRDRRTPQKYFSPVFWTLTGSTVVAGAAMVWLGLRIGQPIFAVFGGVGGLVGKEPGSSDDLVELQVQVAEVCAHEVPVRLLSLQVQLNEVR